MPRSTLLLSALLLAGCVVQPASYRTWSPPPRAVVAVPPPPGPPPPAVVVVERPAPRNEAVVRVDDDRRRDERRDDGDGRDFHPTRGRDHDEGRLRSPDAIIDRAYRELLERKPDREGQEHYRQLLMRGMTDEQLRARLRESVEYRVTLPDSKTRQAYRKVLGRDPDAGGLESYRRKIVDHGWTEKDVENDLRKSAEYRNRKK
ncbi:MAG TPA: hypothetical protein VHE61_16080 [Opitutaceae bacterium]|nr:hypothetical protein [Opitutaceae bacterium]